MKRTLQGSWLLIGMICLLVTGPSAWASSSGLNNIPTTDVVPPKTVVLQTWLNMVNGGQTQQFVGFKAGGFKGLEFGVDWKAIDETHGHAALQVKYAFNIVGDQWQGVLGVANLTDNRQHDGYFFPYAATSLDLELVRLHFGYAPQPHNEAFFAGIDRIIPLFDRNLQLKADAIHFNDKEDILFSVGFLYEFGRLENSDEETTTSGILKLLDQFAKNLILEAWVSMPTTSAEEVYTVKLNYVIKF